MKYQKLCTSCIAVEDRNTGYNYGDESMKQRRNGQNKVLERNSALLSVTSVFTVYTNHTSQNFVV
jgi:hypothetical protein